MSGAAYRRHDPIEDRAAALLRELDSHKTDEPRVAEPMERLVARLWDVGAWAALGLFWTIGAFYIDQLIGGDTVLGPGGPNGELPTEIRRTDPAIAWATFVGLLFSVYLLETVPTALRGGHWAKTRWKLRVVGPDGGPPGFARASVRWVVWWAPFMAGLVGWSATFGTGWGFPFMLLQAAALAVPGAMWLDQDRHLGLHDRLAGTRVLAER